MLREILEYAKENLHAEPVLRNLLGWPRRLLKDSFNADSDDSFDNFDWSQLQGTRVSIFTWTCHNETFSADWSSCSPRTRQDILVELHNMLGIYVRRHSGSVLRSPAFKVLDLRHQREIMELISSTQVNDLRASDMPLTI